MFVTLIALKYALLVSQWSYGHFLKLTDSVFLNNTINICHLTQRIVIVLYPQNGDRIVSIDSVTALQPMYTNLLKLQPNDSETPVSCTVYPISVVNS